MSLSNSNIKNLLATITVMVVIGVLLVVVIPATTFSTPPPSTNAPEVWVNPAWVVNASGDIVDGHIYGQNAFATIGEGVYNASPYAVVHVAAGTYTEKVIIDKPLILNGSKAGILTSDGSRGTGESYIDLSTLTAGDAFTVTSSDVVINGFTVNSNPSVLHGVNIADANNVTLNNTILLGTHSDSILLDGVSGSTIANNYIEGSPLYFAAIDVSASSGSPNTIEGNYIDGFYYGINYVGTAGQILENSLTSGFFQNGIYYSGQGGIINDNIVGTIYTSGAVRSADLSNAVNFITVEGNDVQITDNTVGGLDWYTPGLVSVTGNHALIENNNISAQECDINGIEVFGNDTTIDSNQLTIVDSQGSAIYLQSPMSGLNTGNVTNNDINVTTQFNSSVHNTNIVTVYGDNANVNSNTVAVNYTANDVFYIIGNNGNVNDNTVTANNLGNHTGAGDFVYYSGDAGTVQNNDFTGLGIPRVTYNINDSLVVYYGYKGLITDNRANVNMVYDPALYCNGNNITVSGNTLDIKTIDDNVLRYYGQGGVITRNKFNESPMADGWYGIYYSSVNYGTGVPGTITFNDISNNGLSGYDIDNGIFYASDEGTISDNNILLTYDGSAGDSQALLSVADSKNDVNAANFLIEGCGIFAALDTNNGRMTNVTIERNVIGSGDSDYSTGIYTNADNATVNGNNVDFEDATTGIEVLGNNATVNSNIIGNAKTSDYETGIYVQGDSASINYNTIDGSYIDSEAIYSSGDYSQIGYNTVGTDASIVEYDDGIYAEGDYVGIMDNDFTAYGIGDYGIELYGDHGSINNNEFVNVSDYVDESLIYYEGDSGYIGSNIDNSPYSSDYTLVESYGSHNGIYYNEGGSIISSGAHDNVESNTLTSSYIGVGSRGDFNQIAYNGINSPMGINSVGTSNSIYDNTINASEDGFVPFSGGLPFDLTAGIGFDGDMNYVSDNYIVDAGVGIFNIGEYMNGGLLSNSVVPADYSNDVNSTLDKVMAGITSMSMATSAHVNKLSSSGKIGAQSDSLGYRGYENNIAYNTITNDGTDALAGIVTLGYDFDVSGNSINNVKNSTYVGIITGGDGGTISYNNVKNVSVLGIYYGGLLKFENGIYSSDLLGMNADIYRNTVDNSQFNYTQAGPLYPISLYPVLPFGIVTTTYNAYVDINTVKNLPLGILSLQYGGEIGNNDVRGSAESVAGIAAICDNTEIHNNYIANVTGIQFDPSYLYSESSYLGQGINEGGIGLLLASLDDLSTTGNAAVYGNTLVNNTIQLCVVPPNFQFIDNNWNTMPINRASLDNVLAANNMDRSIYVTDKNGDLSVTPGFVFVRFDGDSFGTVLPTYTVYSVIQDAVNGVSFVYDDAAAMNSPVQSDMPAQIFVKPGTYHLLYPTVISYVPDNLSIIGNPDAPSTTVIDTGSIPVINVESIATPGLPIPMDQNAFDVDANGVTITGFTITNSNNTAANKLYSNGSNAGIAVGYVNQYENSIATPSYLADGGQFMNNTLTGLSTGIYLSSCRNVVIQYNNIFDNNVGVYLDNYAFSNSTQIHYNDITGNFAYGVNNKDVTVVPASTEVVLPSLWVNATYNWWGSISGPHDVSKVNNTGTGDNVTYYVLYEPWLTSPIFSASQTYHLVGGWNLISVPLDVPDTSIAGFFPASVRSDMLTLWAWDASKQDWVFYGSDPNDWYYSQYPALTNVETGRGYWVEMKPNTNDYFEIKGSVPDGAPESSIGLNNGWNLLGLTGVNPSTPSALYPGAFTVWNWDPVAQDWVFYGSDPSDWYYSQYPALSSLHAGQGNWVEKVVV